jgi:hypothetical protein
MKSIAWQMRLGKICLGEMSLGAMLYKTLPSTQMDIRPPNHKVSHHIDPDQG